VIVLNGKLLIVGDSVMGCFLEASGDGDASPDAVYRVVHAVSSNSPSCQGIVCPVDSLILSYQLDVPYHPERCPKKDTFFVEARSLNRHQTWLSFGLSSGNIASSRKTLGINGKRSY
jgi:hypothetical protein